MAYIYAPLGRDELTPWGLNKMHDILPTFLNAFSWEKNLLSQISLVYFPKDTIIE